jgi:hypothetical protein
MELDLVTDTEIADELRAIKAALESHPAPTITGGQLASLIGSAAPDLDVRAVVGKPTGSGAISAFVQSYLADVVERIGNQGADTLHRILGREVELIPAPSSSPQNWRTFVSPNSVQHLVLSPSAQSLFVRETPASSADGEIEVAKASSEEHDAMRQDFVSSLPEAVAAILKEYAGYDSWIAALRQRLPKAMPRWGAFRRERLSDLFVSRITELELEEALREIILKQIRDSETSAYRAAKKGKALPAGPGEAQSEGAQDMAQAVSRARRLAHAAIDRLGYEELRALKMPLGAVLDAIQTEA